MAPVEVCVIRSLAVGDASVGETTLDCLAVGDFAVGHAAIGFGVAELGFEQSATLLLFLLQVLKDGHWIAPRLPRAPLPALDRIATFMGSNVLPLSYHEKVATDTGV